MTQAPRPDDGAPRSGPARPGGSIYGSARVVPPAVTPPTFTPPPVSAPRQPPGTVHPLDPASPSAQGPARKRWPLAVLIIVVLLVALLGGGAALQLHRALPAATLATSIAASLRIPGATPKMPWPTRGSAELMVEGLGRMGGSGSAAAKPIGSVAKVMTAYVILRDHPLRDGEEGPDLRVGAADVADYQRRTLTGQSLVRVVAGETLSERDALEALMLPSANNVALLLAKWDAGSEAAFLDKMNAAAGRLGMTGSRYTDPSGFLPSTESTARDQVTLARAALKLPSFAGLVEQRTATIPVEGEIRNYNDLLGENGVFGIKTGSTTQAGGNLVFAARLTVGGRTLTVVGAVFNQPGAHTAEQLAQVDVVVRRLLTAAHRAIQEYTVLGRDRVGTVTTAWGASTSVRPAGPVKVVGWPGMKVALEVTRVAPGAVVAPGQLVGTVQAKSGASASKVELRAETATEDASLWWRLTRKP
jgi:serine-type D-Ala-D-Ala carboxypeptidase (penicillin-binding protein 5/6)